MEEVKKSKKKNKVASLLLALALILTCGVAGTIAQYTKSVGGYSNATVAKFKVSATGLGKVDSTDIHLFDNVIDTDTANGTIHSTGDRTVAGTAIIAPGTGGSIPVTLTNESDVAVDYALTVKLKDDTGVYNNTADQSDPFNGQKIPLQFALVAKTDITKVTSSEWVDMDDLTSSTNGLKNTSGTLGIGSSAATTTPANLNLFWRWAYEDDAKSTARNELDTAIGEAIGTSKFTAPEAEISVVFTQKD